MRENSLDDIYKLYINDLHYYLLSLCKDKYIVEDILQDTFYKAYLHFESCPKERVKSWLFTIAHNAYIDYLRKNKRSIPREDLFFHQVEGNTNIEQEYLAKENLGEIESIIKTLPIRQRQAIHFCDFEELSYKEGAEKMRISLSYYKVLVFRARQAIREKMKGRGKDER
ncbi:sigma-70 family RNA polymerase sigma factor [Irregularibacter muris]|uniref:Sigma-70 family RNA polymerase sigma factor n=1 Tax=Irregularibacter muris TaxID=1796619 RepID=A0AAE3HE16_9FIRM|nr:sigma-70 family RNA polymerase sigma factor [Irregularibacter muris]MCR1898406.1 sigma-70 family RNA polymerase sigma factor [Irregularibacter muris]